MNEQTDSERCPYCDGTGDVHAQTGEWRGRCSCPAGQEIAQPMSGPAGVDGVTLAWLIYLPREQAQRVYDSQEDPGYVDDLTNNPDAQVTPLFAHQEAAPAQWQETGEPPIWEQVEAIGKEGLADAMAGMTSGADTFFDDMPDQVQPPVALLGEQEVLQQVLEATSMYLTK